MNPNLKFPERNAIVATIDPVAQAVGTVTTGWVSMAQFHSITALIQTGVLGSGATVDAKLQQATSAAGAGAKDIAGKALTQIVKASGDAKQATIDLRGTDLDGNGGFSFVALTLTVGGATSLLSAALIGNNPVYVPASAANQAGVLQQVG